MNSIPAKTPVKKDSTDAPVNWMDLVRQHVASLQFGTVEIVVHDSRVVQIEKTERVRLGHADAGHAAKVATPGSSSGTIADGSGSGAVNVGA